MISVAKDSSEKRYLTAKQFLLAAVSCLFALLLAETACRLLLPPQPSIRFQQDVSELQGLKLDEAARMIRNDSELFWRLAPDIRLPEASWPFFGIISNGQSLREDQEIPLEKPTGQPRILFLGDSCTFGYGVAHDRTFVEVAESLLADRCDGSVQCINAGVPGYTLFQGYRYLVAEGLRYLPDLVVLNFGWNDFGMWDPFGDIEHHAALKATLPPALLRSSRLCQLLWACLRKPPSSHADAATRPRMLPGEFAQTLATIHAVLAERRIPMLILVWPMRANTGPETPPDARTSLQMEMTAFGQAHPLSTSPSVSGVLDLVSLAQQLVREHGANAIYFDQGHVTPIGHQAVAEAIVAHITPWFKGK